MNEYQSAYLRQTTPVTPTYMTGYTSPSVSQQVIDLLESRPPIPAAYDILMEVEDYSSIDGDFEYVPFFWHVYRSAGGTMIQLMGECLGLTLASSFPFAIDGLFQADTTPRVMRYDDVKYFNVNLKTQAGIQRAKNMEIVLNTQTDPDAVISPYLYGIISTLLSKKERYSEPVKGGMFTMTRNPIEREISNFYSVRSQSEDKEVSSYELSDWIGLPTYAGNSMIRQLTNKMDPAITVTLEDLLVAKEILRRKCIIGLLEQKQESWSRFQQIHDKRWKLKDRDYNSACVDRLLNWGWRNRNSIKPFIDISVEKSLQREDRSIVDKTTYKQIASLNQLDMLLYEYCKYLFTQQRVLFYEDESTNDSTNGATHSTNNNSTEVPSV